MPWIMLSLAIVSEIIGTTALKLTHGELRPVPVAIVAIGYLVSFAAMAKALISIDVGVAYAIWSGIGTAAVAVIGALAFGEVITLSRAIWLLVIIVGVVGLQLSSM